MHMLFSKAHYMTRNWHCAVNATRIIAPYYFVTTLSEQYLNEIFGDVLRITHI
jgi:hypothetical protein